MEVIPVSAQLGFDTALLFHNVTVGSEKLSRACWTDSACIPTELDKY